MIYCDKCTHEFTPDLKVRNRTISVKETYFRCPQCREHYTAFYTNQEARRLQRVIKANPNDYAAKHTLQAIMADLRRRFGA